MAEQKTKTYVPKSSAKLRKVSFGDVISLSFKSEDLIAFAKAHANDKGYLNLEILPRKTPSDYGDTHSVSLNDWKPATATTQVTKKVSEPVEADPDDSEVPF